MKIQLPEGKIGYAMVRTLHAAAYVVNMILALFLCGIETRSALQCTRCGREVECSNVDEHNRYFHP